MIAVLLLSAGDRGAPTARPALDAGRPEVRQALGRAVAQRQRLASPRAKRERRRSRSAYTDLPAGRALSLGRRAHRSVLRDRTPRPLEGARRRGLKVARFASPFAAVLRPKAVRSGRQQGVMAMSTLPLRSRDEHGRLRLVDLQPRRAGGAFVPDNARVKLSIGDRASDGVRVVDRDIAIVPLNVKAVAGVKSADAVFFGESAQASDHIVRVSPAGVDNLVQLRGRASPERFRYRVDLPARGTLDEVAGGDIAVRVGGRRVGTITKPKAWDADQRPIPVKATLQGRVLTLDIAHRDRDIRYPSMLDPNYVDILQYRWYTPGANTGTNRYWAFRTNDANKMGGAFGNVGQGNFGQTNGLYAGTRGNQFLNAGQFGYWTFTAPGTTSVAQAEWTRLSHLEIHTGGPPPCIDYGLIYNTTAWRTVGTECANFQPAYRLTCWDCNDRDGVSHDPTVKGAQFGSGVYFNTIANVSDYAGEVTLYVVDPDDPTVTFTSRPSEAWTKTPSGTIAATGNDPGLGVQSMTITNAGTVANSDCLQAGPCPFSQPRSASVASLNLPDGNNTIAVTARDASFFSFRDANGNPVPAQHEKTATTQVKLDREKPTIQAPSGSLYDARDGFVGPNQDYAFSVTATDGSPSPLSAQRSGVVSLTATLNGQPMTMGSKTEACTRAESSCPLTITPTLSRAQVSQLDEAAVHSVSITATDAAGNISDPTTFTFSVDATDPSVSASGPLGGSDGAILIDDRYTMDAYGDDQLGRNGLRSGIRSLTIEVDPDTSPPDADHRFVLTNSTCQRNTCSTPLELTDQFEYVASKYGTGDHHISVTVEDAVGNTALEDISFNTPHAAPLPAQTLDISDGSQLAVDGAAPGDRLGASLANVGDVNGDGRDDLVSGAPGADVAGQADAGAAYLIYGSPDSSPVSLAGSDPRVVRLSFNQGGANAGAAVAAGGDINGDGRMDLLVGAPGSSPLGLAPVQGRVWAIFGASDLPAEINLAALGSRGFEIRGPLLSGTLIPPLLSPTATSTFGGQIATRRMGDYEVEGDVNGDGLDDIVLGSGNTTSPALTGGVAYVVFGRTQTSTIDLGPTNGDLGANGFRIYGAKSSLEILDPGQAGTSTTIIGDVNGDERAEIAVTDPGQHATGRTNAGTAYVIFGRAATSTIGLSNLGDAGYTITGRANDAVATAASPDDIDADGRPDLLLGGHGGFVHFTKIDTTGQDLDGSFDGYRLDPPSGSGFARATVAGVGDQDGDQAPDTLVGFPQADSNRGVAYLAYGKMGSDRVDLGTLRGDQGTRLDGGAATRSASAAEGTDVTGQQGSSASVFGSPDASANRGQLRNVPSGRLAQQARTEKFGCAVRGVGPAFAPPAFPFASAAQPSPFCRRALRNNIDIPLSGMRRKAFNPRPRCGLYSPNTKCFPSAFNQGNARKQKPLLARSNVRYPLYDSFGPTGTSPRHSPRATGPIAFIEQGSPGCFNVYDSTNTFRNSVGSDMASMPCSSTNVGPSTMVEYQGRTCMATRSLEDDFVLARIIGDGIQGMLSVDAVPVARGVPQSGRGVPDGAPQVDGGFRTRDFADLQDAYGGCGRKRPRQQPLGRSQPSASRRPASQGRQLCPPTCSGCAVPVP